MQARQRDKRTDSETIRIYQGRQKKIERVLRNPITSHNPHTILQLNSSQYNHPEFGEKSIFQLDTFDLSEKFPFCFSLFLHPSWSRNVEVRREGVLVLDAEKKIGESYLYTSSLAYQKKEKLYLFLPIIMVWSRRSSVNLGICSSILDMFTRFTFLRADLNKENEFSLPFVKIWRREKRELRAPLLFLLSFLKYHLK